MTSYTPNFTIVPAPGIVLGNLDKLFAEIFGDSRPAAPTSRSPEVIEVHPKTLAHMIKFDLVDVVGDRVTYMGRKLVVNEREAPFISDAEGYIEAFIRPAACDCQSGCCLEVAAGDAGSAAPEDVDFIDLPYDIELEEAVAADHRETAAALVRSADNFASALVLISTFAGEAYAR